MGASGAPRLCHSSCRLLLATEKKRTTQRESGKKQVCGFRKGFEWIQEAVSYGPAHRHSLHSVWPGPVRAERKNAPPTAKPAPRGDQLTRSDSCPLAALRNFLVSSLLPCAPSALLTTAPFRAKPRQNMFDGPQCTSFLSGLYPWYKSFHECAKNARKRHFVFVRPYLGRAVRDGQTSA